MWSYSHLHITFFQLLINRWAHDPNWPSGEESQDFVKKSHIVRRVNIAYHQVYDKISKRKIWKTLVGPFLLKYKAMNPWGNNMGLENQTGKNDLGGCLFPLCVCLCPLALLTDEPTGPLTYRYSPHLSQRSQAGLSWSRKYLRGLRSSLLQWECGVGTRGNAHSSLLGYLLV